MPQLNLGELIRAVALQENQLCSSGGEPEDIFKFTLEMPNGKPILTVDVFDNRIVLSDVEEY